MAKRFIDTERYRRALRGVDCRIRFAHEWLWHNCDNAGIWTTDLDLFKFECGYPLNIEGLLKACPWVQQLPNGSLFITDFLEVNYGKLKDGYNPHKPVFRSLRANGIDPESLEFQPLTNPCPRVEEEGEEEDIGIRRKERAIKFPEPLNNPEFIEAWDRWEQHRREKRQKLTPSTRQQQIAKCLEWGSAKSIAAIRHTIEKGWTGLFEPPALKVTAADRRKATEPDQFAPVTLGKLGGR